MRSRDFLEQLWTLDVLIDEKIDEIKRCIEKAISISINYEEERVSSSNIGDIVGNGVVNYVMKEQELKEELYALEKERKDIIDVLKRLPKAEHQVLRFIYVKNLEYYQIMDILDRSKSWVRNHHYSGLKQVQKIIDAEDFNGNT